MPFYQRALIIPQSLLLHSGVLNEPLLNIIYVINAVHIFIDSRPPKQCWFESCSYLIFCFEFIGNSSWDPDCIYVNVWIRWPLGEVTTHFCFLLVREGLGFQNAKVKGIANLTKVQVHSIWPEDPQVRVHKNTSRCLSWKSLEQFYWFPLQRIGLHCTWIRSPETLIPTPPN
jgi:hypothetical protein